MSAFLGGLQDVLAADAPGVDKARVLRAAAEVIERTGAPPRLRIVPFVPGHRPLAEAAAPGLGSSEDVALILPGDEQDRAHVLYDVGEDLDVRARLSFTGPDGSLAPVPVPGWEERAAPELRIGARHVLAIDPATLRPTGSHSANCSASGCLVELRGPPRRRRGRGVRDVALRLRSPPLRVAVRAASSTASSRPTRQAAEAGVANPGAAYHPWFPVLVIGSDKAALYTRALVHDIAGSGAAPVRSRLADARRAVPGVPHVPRHLRGGRERRRRPPLPRRARPPSRTRRGSSRSARRSTRTPGARSGSCGASSCGAPRTGPVSARNLLAKKKATLRFLHVHHDDLKHAIRLAGANHHNAQETWQRVFRDAERAVLRKSPRRSPSCRRCPSRLRDFVLWHRKGRSGSARAARARADQRPVRRSGRPVRLRLQRSTATR